MKLDFYPYIILFKTFRTKKMFTLSNIFCGIYKVSNDLWKFRDFSVAPLI